jgi:adenylate cyclase
VAREQHKLAAILAADVVGYSRLMGQDESGTLAQFHSALSSKSTSSKIAQMRSTDWF